MGKIIWGTVVLIVSVAGSLFVVERARNWAVLQPNNDFAAFIMDSTAGANYGIAVLVVIVILILLYRLLISRFSE